MALWPMKDRALNMQEFVQRAARHELGEHTKRRRREACPDEAHQPRVSKESQGFDFAPQLLQAMALCRGAGLELQPLDRDLHTAKAAAIHGSEAAGTEAFPESDFLGTHKFVGVQLDHSGVSFHRVGHGGGDTRSRTQGRRGASAAARLLLQRSRDTLRGCRRSNRGHSALTIELRVSIREVRCAGHDDGWCCGCDPPFGGDSTVAT
mmetsp:Transcript_76018/g.211219  ORF Transcript_76018/g.211219 Transcript_76018/m.211219 type:complete len:207 (+) Transcript_76018:581-1201(+)